MSDRQTHLRALIAAPVLLCLGIAGAAAGALKADESAAPLGCEIRASSVGGMTLLSAVVHSASPIAGSYELRVRGGGSGGSTDISQGGDFEAKPDDVIQLGQVMLGSGSYRASLDLSVDGTIVSCRRDVYGST